MFSAIVPSQCKGGSVRSARPLKWHARRDDDRAQRRASEQRFNNIAALCSRSASNCVDRTAEGESDYKPIYQFLN